MTEHRHGTAAPCAELLGVESASTGLYFSGVGVPGPTVSLILPTFSENKALLASCEKICS